MESIPDHHLSGPDTEQLNRNNFRSCLYCLSRPGSRKTISPLFGSSLLGLASMLLYSEVSHYYDGVLKDFELVRAMTGSSCAALESCDYLFCDHEDPALIKAVTPGSLEHPENGVTCVIDCSSAKQVMTQVELDGPGISGRLVTSLPLSETFLDTLIKNRPPFPMGIDLFLLAEKDQVIGLSRTTNISVIV